MSNPTDQLLQAELHDQIREEATEVERERILAIIEDQLRAYPTDVFPELDQLPQPPSGDRHAGAMARFICEVLIRRIGEQSDE